MQLHATMKCFTVVVLPCAIFWSSLIAVGADNIQGKFSKLTAFTCDGVALCATSEPSMRTNVRSKGQWTFECQHHPESCVSVSYQATTNTCEIYSANPTNFTKDVPGCQHFQVPVYNIIKLCIRVTLHLTKLDFLDSGLQRHTNFQLSFLLEPGLNYRTQLRTSDVILEMAVSSRGSLELDFWNVSPRSRNPNVSVLPRGWQVWSQS